MILELGWCKGGFILALLFYLIIKMLIYLSHCYRLACVMDNRPEACGAITLNDFFMKKNVSFDAALKLLQENQTPGEENEFLMNNQETKGDLGCSMIEIKLHKSSKNYSLWIILSPVEETMLFAYEHLRSKFLSLFLKWSDDQVSDRMKTLSPTYKGLISVKTKYRSWKRSI